MKYLSAILLIYSTVQAFTVQAGVIRSKSGLSGQVVKPSAVDHLPLNLEGVTIVPHFVSGEIPNYPDEEKYLSKYKPGALIRIFIKNTSQDESINPEVLFNGKTGQDLIGSGLVSCCDAPDIRRNITGMSAEIPSGAIDCYLLNVVDSGFYGNGITLSITDRNSGKSEVKHIKIVKPQFYVTRIAFTSENGSSKPVGFNVFFRNGSNKKVTVNKITVFKSRPGYTEHWWKEILNTQKTDWFGENGFIGKGDINGVYVRTGELPFGEIIVEFEVSGTNVGKKILYVVKPFVLHFDIGFGWADKYLAGSEAFCKTMALMHLNTVNGNAKKFFENKEWEEKYPIKKFAKLADVDVQNTPENLKRIHGAEHFGEPQFKKQPAQEIYNYYTTYRGSGYPTTLTLSHEPGFFLYAGVVDFAHFDAYRVVAPHADRWGAYQKYGDRNVRWGSPLETIGDYMRTLNRISYPNPVAAWAQAMSDGWSSRFRPGAGNPNNLEMRIQAYEAIANGALSLYWFNINGKNLIGNRNSLSEIQQINRELVLTGDLLLKTTPFWWKNRFMDIDLNVLAGPDYAVLTAIDLKYAVSTENQFVSKGERSETMEFVLPSYLLDCDGVVKITSDGIIPVSLQIREGNAVISDKFTTTAMYVLYRTKNSDMAEVLNRKYQEIIRSEQMLNFNPVTSDMDFKILKEEVGKIENEK